MSRDEIKIKREFSVFNDLLSFFLIKSLKPDQKKCYFTAYPADMERLYLPGNVIHINFQRKQTSGIGV